MFSRQYNQVRIEISLTPRSPLLIRSGRSGASVDPTRPELECIRTRYGERSSVFIPGSSLKGVLRSHAERLLRSEGIPVTPTFCEEAKKKFKKESPGVEVYARTCPLGRTFGTLHLKGRTAIQDLLPGAREADRKKREPIIEAANATEQRMGVAIDRLLGSAKGRALYDQELVVGGRFDGAILMRNIQLYQLALVLLTLDDLKEGFVRLGSGTTRGNGWVDAQVSSVCIETRRRLSPSADPGKRLSPSPKLTGLGGNSGLAEDYRLYPGDEIELGEGIESGSRFIWDRVEVNAESYPSLLEALADGPWSRFVEEAWERGRKNEWVA